jgi:hypothetical protein
MGFLKRAFLGIELGLIPVFFILWYFPFINFPIRVATAIVGFALLCSALFLGWKRTWARRFLLFVYVFLVVFIEFPLPHPVDHESLRTAYCDALKSYTGRPYVWGGESYFGIDCSGLIRKSMEDALAWQGFTTFNPSWVRESFSLYWHDTTARVIGEGYGGRTRLIAQCNTLNTFDDSILQPGDMAVTTSGIHIMAYLGNHTWIAADPDPNKVVLFTVPEEKSSYFSTPMRLVRWKLLDNQSSE